MKPVTILLGTGDLITGHVQGAGGFANSRRVAAACRLASSGRRTGLYEPKPGCVALYENVTAADNGPVTIVSLIGAEVQS